MKQFSSIKFGIHMMLIGWIHSYELTCPALGHWNFRRTLICKEVNNYTCIYDDINQSITENCDGPVPLGKGYKAIHRGNIDRKSCSDARYQPFTFSTVWYSKCVFLKSVCNEEGQVTIRNEISTKDRICGCDYQNLYAFIVKPSYLNNCRPSEEDCSCYKQLCPEEQRYLSKDYKCIDKRIDYTTVNPDTAVLGTKVMSKDTVHKDNKRKGDYSYISRYTLSAISVGVIVYIGFAMYCLLTKNFVPGSRNETNQELEQLGATRIDEAITSFTNDKSFDVPGFNAVEFKETAHNQKCFQPHSGLWYGSFILHKSTCRFMVKLECDNEQIKGDGIDKIDSYYMTGEWNTYDGTVAFIKHYNKKNYDVRYTGQLSLDGRSMCGRYVVENRSGDFTMHLPDETFLMKIKRKLFNS